MKLEINTDWFVSEKICVPVKKVVGVVHEEQYVSVGAVFNYLTNSDIVFLKLMFDQHIEEMRIGKKAGIDPTNLFAIHNVSVLLATLLIGEGYTLISVEEILKAKEKLAIILNLEMTAIINNRDFKSIVLKRPNYNLTEDKNFKFVEFERKNET